MLNELYLKVKATEIAFQPIELEAGKKSL